MMVKRILVGLAGTSYTPVAIQRAVMLAQAHNAEVTGVTVLDARRVRMLGGAGPLTHEAECQPCQEQPGDEFDMAIRELAHFKWEAAGFPAGDGFDFWLEAEREVKADQPASNPAAE